MLKLFLIYSQSFSQVYRYQEEYELCLGGFKKASLYDPGWEDPLKLQEKLLKYLHDILELIHNKVRNQNVFNLVSNLLYNIIGTL